MQLRITPPPPRSELGKNFWRELRQQPHILGELIRARRRDVEEFAREWKAKAPAFALISARGSSDNAARYGQYVLGALAHIPVALAAPSLTTVYRVELDLSAGVTLGISQSGQSPDVAAVVDAASRQGGLTAAITNDPNSALANSTPCTLKLDCGEEKAVAATKTHTAQLMMLAMLGAALSGSEQHWDELRQVPDWIAETIDKNAAFCPSPRLLRNDAMAVVGRGYNYGAAFETALKIKETNYIVAEAYSPADLLHGPIAVVRDRFPVLLIAPLGAVSLNMEALVKELTRRRARILVISDDRRMRDTAEVSLTIPSTPEWLSPFVTTVAGQIFAGAMAISQQLDPDHPEGLSKITLTT